MTHFIDFVFTNIHFLYKYNNYTHSIYIYIPYKNDKDYNYIFILKEIKKTQF